MVKNKKQVIVIGGENVFDKSASKRAIFAKVEAQRVFEPQLIWGCEGKPPVCSKRRRRWVNKERVKTIQQLT